MNRDSSQTDRIDKTNRQRTDTAESRASPGSTYPNSKQSPHGKAQLETETKGEVEPELDYHPKLDGLPVIPRPTMKRLTGRQLIDYKSHREKLLLWMLNRGKQPDKGQGYA